MERITGTKLKLAPHILVNQFDSDLIFLDLENGRYFTVEEVGKVIWDGLAKMESVGQIKKKILDRYSVEEEVADMDIQHFIADLVSKKIFIPQDDKAF